MDFDPEKDYYRALHVDRHASAADVKKAFFTLAKKYHPDTKKSLHDADVEEVFTEKYREVNEAHRVLSDARLRAGYDRARDLRELGTVSPQQSQPAPPARPAAEPEQRHPQFDLPDLIRSDRGALFVRRAQDDTFLGEDGAHYDVTEDGRIRRIADPGLMGSVQRYAVTGSPGEIIVGWIGRVLLRVGIVVARAVAAVLVNYPLFLSMTVVHLNPVHRLRQERAFIGLVTYAAFTALNLLSLAGVVLLGLRVSPIGAGIAFAAHLIASSLFVLDLRASYLRLLDEGGAGNALDDTPFQRRFRRATVVVLYAAQLGLGVWMVLEMLPPPTAAPSATLPGASSLPTRNVPLAPTR